MLKLSSWRFYGFLLAAGLSTGVLSAQSAYPPGFPDFLTVEKTFFERYDPVQDYIRVVKKLDGYYVVPGIFGAPKQPEPLLFWSAATHSFQSVPLRRGSSQDRFTNRDPANFDRQPCYDYPGWFHDAIAYLEKRPNPTAAERHALARAWSRASQNLIPASYVGRTEADSSEQFALDLRHPRLTPAQEQLYRRRIDRALELYREIAAHDSHFPTPVGPIQTKLANEIVDKYLILSIVSDEKRARAELPRDLYPPFIRESAFNLLQSCPPNAILLTWGDTDTYPLLYLQATEKVRPDVLVANTSLLYSPFFNRHLRYDTIFAALPPPRTLRQSFYDETPVLYFDVASSTKFNIADYFHTLETGRYRANSSESGVHYNLPWSGSLRIPVNLVAGAPPPVPAPLSPSDTLHFDFGQVLFGDAQMALDWLMTDGWNRPICYSLTCDDQALKPFGAHLVQQGLVYRLYPTAPATWKSYAPDAAMDVEATWKLWQSFRWQSRDSITAYDGTPYQMAHFMTALRLSNRLVETGDQSRARAVLDAYFQAFPNTRALWDYRMIYLAKSYALAGDKPSAALVLGTLLDNYTQDRYPSSDRTMLEQQREWMLGIAREYGLAAVESRLQAVFKD